MHKEYGYLFVSKYESIDKNTDKSILGEFMPVVLMTVSRLGREVQLIAAYKDLVREVIPIGELFFWSPK